MWAVIEDKLLVLKSGGDSGYLRRAHGCAEDAAAAAVQLCAGHLCAVLEEARTSGCEALTLGGRGECGVFDITDPQCRFAYLMRRAAEREEDFVGRMYRELGERFSGRELETMLSTAAAYYEAGGSVTKAAEALHVHKNTLQYRMRRLWEAVCPGVGGSFEREFLLRLCILYHRQLRLRTPLI